MTILTLWCHYGELNFWSPIWPREWGCGSPTNIWQEGWQFSTYFGRGFGEVVPPSWSVHSIWFFLTDFSFGTPSHFVLPTRMMEEWTLLPVCLRVSWDRDPIMNLWKHYLSSVFVGFEFCNQFYQHKPVTIPWRLMNRKRSRVAVLQLSLVMIARKPSCTLAIIISLFHYIPSSDI